MSTIPPTIYLLMLLLCLGSVACFALAGGYFIDQNSPQKKERRALMVQAKLDYAAARGTHHLSLLKQGARNVRSRLKAEQSQLNQHKAKLDQVEKDKQNGLRTALDWYIVNRHMDNVTGIGPNLQTSLITLFRSRITDLQYAQGRIQGIGNARQAAINGWIQYYLTQIPKMLEGDFPGKASVLKTYDPLIREVQGNIEPLQETIEHDQKRLKQIDDEIALLAKVTIKDFRNAYLAPGENPYLDYYLNGVFSEWEPVPDWFKEMLSDEE